MTTTARGLSARDAPDRGTDMTLNKLEITDRQAFLINLLAKGFLGETMYTPKDIPVVRAELANLIGETQSASDRFESNTREGV